MLTEFQKRNHNLQPNRKNSQSKFSKTLIFAPIHTTPFCSFHQDFINFYVLSPLIYNLQVLLNCCWRRSRQNGGWIKLWWNLHLQVAVGDSCWSVNLWAEIASSFTFHNTIPHLFLQIELEIARNRRCIPRKVGFRNRRLVQLA